MMIRPILAASAPLMMVPRIKNSFARWVQPTLAIEPRPPSPATSPTRATCVSAMRAVSDATVMSHMRAIVAANPMQSPLIAQIIGCSQRKYCLADGFGV